jgi:hypothetical protein
MPGKTRNSRKQRGGGPETLSKVSDIKLQQKEDQQRRAERFQQMIARPYSAQLQASMNQLSTLSTDSKLKQLEPFHDYLESIEANFTNWRTSLPSEAPQDQFIAYVDRKVDTLRKIRDTVSSSAKYHEVSAYVAAYQQRIHQLDTFVKLLQQHASIFQSDPSTLPLEQKTQLESIVHEITHTPFAKRLLATDTVYTGILAMETNESGAPVLPSGYAIPIVHSLDGYTLLPDSFEDSQLTTFSPEIVPAVHTIALEETKLFHVPRSMANGILLISASTPSSPGIVLPKHILQQGDSFIIHNTQTEAPVRISVPLLTEYFSYVLLPSEITLFVYTKDTESLLYGIHEIRESAPLPLGSFLRLDTTTNLFLYSTESGTPITDMYGVCQTMQVPRVLVDGAPAFDLQGSIRRDLTLLDPFTGYVYLDPTFRSELVYSSPFARATKSGPVVCNEHGYPILNSGGNCIRAPKEGIVLDYEPLEAQGGCVDPAPLINLETVQQERDTRLWAHLFLARMEAYFTDTKEMLSTFKEKERIFEAFLPEASKAQVKGSIDSFSASLAELHQAQTPMLQQFQEALRKAASPSDFQILVQSLAIQADKLELSFTGLKGITGEIQSAFDQLRTIDLLIQEGKRIVESIQAIFEKASQLQEKIQKDLAPMKHDASISLQNKIQDTKTELANHLTKARERFSTFSTLKEIPALELEVNNLRIELKQASVILQTFETLQKRDVPEVVSSIQNMTRTYKQDFQMYTLPYVKIALDLESSLATPELLQEFKQRQYPIFFWLYSRQFFTEDRTDLTKDLVSGLYATTLAAAQKFISTYSTDTADQPTLEKAWIEMKTQILALKSASDAVIKQINSRVFDAVSSMHTTIETSMKETLQKAAGYRLFASMYKSTLQGDAEFAVKMDTLAQKESSVSQALSTESTLFQRISQGQRPHDFAIQPTTLQLQEAQQRVKTLFEDLSPVLQDISQRMGPLQDKIKEDLKQILQRLKELLEKQRSTVSANLEAAKRLLGIEDPLILEVKPLLEQAIQALQAHNDSFSIKDISTLTEIPALYEEKQKLEGYQTTLKDLNSKVIPLSFQFAGLLTGSNQPALQEAVAAVPQLVSI